VTPEPADDLADDFRADAASVIAGARALARGELTQPSEAALVVIRREVGRLASVEPRVLGQALDALLVAPEAVAALRLLEAWGVVRALLPEVQAMVRLHADADHKDLWAHTLQVVARAAPDPDLRWIALCHDVGKPATRATDEGGRVTFLRHEALGARLVRGIGARLELPARRIERIAFVVEHHARTNQFDPEWTDRALRRLVRDAGPYLRDMLAFSAVDWTSKRPGEAARIRKNLALIESRLASLTADHLKWSPPTGLGAALADALERLPGPWLGELMRALAAAVDDGRLEPDATLAELIAFAAQVPAQNV